MPDRAASRFGPDCVKTLRGITAPEIFGPVVMRRAKKCKNVFRSALRPNQIGLSADFTLALSFLMSTGTCSSPFARNFSGAAGVGGSEPVIGHYPHHPLERFLRNG
jgi:hypothetical protein